MAIVAVELVVTLVLLARVQVHGATVWKMGAILRTGAEAPSRSFLQRILTQYGMLVGQFGALSLMLLVYAVLIAVACVIGVLAVAVTLVDWACYLAWLDGTAGPFATRRGQRYLRHGWATCHAPTLVPAMLITFFVMIPGFIDQPNMFIPTQTPAAATPPSSTG